jgi:hypothetical protein
LGKNLEFNISYENYKFDIIFPVRFAAIGVLRGYHCYNEGREAFLYQAVAKFSWKLPACWNKET